MTELSRAVMAEWVRTRPVAPMTKLVLLLLFDHAGPQASHDGMWGAWCAWSKIASEAGLANPETVRKHVVALEEAGIVQREDRATANGRSTSRLVLLLPPSDQWGAPPLPSGGPPLSPEGGTTLTPTDEASTSDDVVNARGDEIPKSMTFRRRKVPTSTIEVAARAVRYFATKTGQTLAIVDGTGAASESMKRVAGAMLAHPELADPAFAQRTIDFALAAPWWKDEGKPGVGVVFGPKVVERMIGQARADAPPAPRPASARESASDLLRDLDA